MKIPESRKKLIKMERDKVFLRMCEDTISQEEWQELNRRYQTYNDMLNPTFKVSGDTVLVVGGNLAIALLTLNFERVDLLRSKVTTFLLKARV